MADEEVSHVRSRDASSAPKEQPEISQPESLKKAVPLQWSLASWKTFLNERAPPVVFVLLALGPTLTGLKMVEGFVDFEKLLWAGFGLWLLLLTIRVMDDVKDYDKDVIVHPDRPLPRGLISVEEVTMAIKMSLALLLLLAFLIGWRYDRQTGGLFAFLVVFGILMYFEFGIGDWLEERPLLYALTHQILIYFCGMFICALAGKEWYSSQGIQLGSVALSGFFTYEVCRKLDPTLPLIKGTYLVVYGKAKTYCIVLCSVLLGVVTSYTLGLHYVLWPMEIVMLTSLLVLFLVPQSTEKGSKPKAHKPVEGLAVLYVLVHLWSGFCVAVYRDLHS
jgi:4-hydroxybenzoate polyprenyltransferase